MAHSLATLLTISNLGISGDIGGMTAYNTASGLLVVFPAAPPKEPASKAQIVFRQRWSLAMSSWTRLAIDEQTIWRQLTIAAGLKISPLNLWCYYQVTKDRNTLATLERQTGIQLPGI